MDKLDYKKLTKELYLPKVEPSLVQVPEMKFIQIDGKGNPNDIDGEYHKAVETLYAISYGIKMLPRNGITPEGYFDYVVPPLEGLWWLEDDSDRNFTNKSKFLWTSMIRQPDFVNVELFKAVLQKVSEKKPDLPLSQTRLVSFSEGLCVHCMHIGSFDEEQVTVEKIDQFIEKNNLLNDFSESRKHHEIYLSDPRKTDRSKLKTIIRHPVKREP
jgi:hypothetical protein